MQSENGVAKYLRDVSNIFVAKVRRECADQCNATDITSGPISIQINVQSDSMSEITWNTDESYRLDVSTAGNISTHIHKKHH